MNSLLNQIARLDTIDGLQLPNSLFDSLGNKVLESYRQRAAVEQPFELRRHPPELRATLVAIYCHHRRRELIDSLVDLLVTLIHRVGARAERKVEKHY